MIHVSNVALCRHVAYGASTTSCFLHPELPAQRGVDKSKMVA